MRSIKYLLLLLALTMFGLSLGANTRDRQKIGYRGRVSQQLVGRQGGAGFMKLGLGSDPLANLIVQGGGPRTAGGTAVAYHRIPTLVKAANGDYLCFYDARAVSSDASGYAILVIRSSDKGVTWGSPVTVYNHSTFTNDSDWIAAGSVVVDEITNPGNMWYFYTQATGAAGTATNHKVFYTKSTDHGASWNTPVEITSTVKVAGGGATPAGNGFPAVNWTWCAPACTAGIQIKNGARRGRMIVPFDHRITDFASSSVSKSHVIKSDDAGANWGLYSQAGDGGPGGLDQSNASNDGSNECAITETTTPDKLVMHIRNVATGNPRYQSISTDCGANWSTMTALTNLECGVGSGTSSDVKQCGPLTVAAYSSDILHAQRATMCLAYSTDNGATWPGSTARIMGTGSYAGYSSMLVDGDNILVAYESGGGNISASPATTFSSPTAYAIKLLRTNRQYLLSPTMRYSQWYFNEEASGTVAPTFGTQIIDYGNLGVNATAGTAAAPPSYTSDGIALSSATADNIILAQADETAFDFKNTDSFTVEVEATLTASTNGALVGKLSGSNGWQFEVTGGKLKGTIGDGSTVTVTGDTTVNGGGARKVYAFVRNTVADTIQVYIDGVADRAAGAVNDSTSSSLTTGAVACICGDNAAGTLPLGGTIHSVRITRGVPNVLLSGTQTKKTQDEFRRNTNPVVAYPSIAAPKLWVCRTSDNGLSAFGDVYATERFRLPLAAGDAVRSVRDNSVLRRRFYNSESSRLLYAVDAKMGPCFDLDEQSLTDNARIKDLTCYGATNGVDFIQNTGTFTIAFVLNVKASTTNYQTIISNNDASGTATGFYIIRADGAAGKLALLVANGAAQFNETIATAPAISYGSTYFCAFVGQGTGNKVLLYVLPITSNYNAASPVQPPAAASNVYASSANFGSVAGQPFTTGAGAYLTVGGRTTANNVLNGYLKNVMIFDSALSAANIDALALYCVSQ